MIERMEQMLALYESGALDRRQFLHGLLALSVASPAQTQTPKAAFRGRVINHVTLSVADVNRSRAFYQGLLGAMVINPQTNNGKPPQSFDLRVGDSFIGLYPLGQPGRIDHFCVGIENYDADKVLAQLKQTHAANRPHIAGDKEVYLTDPDGIRLQLSATNLKL
jgi:catechol 2,3-dioxygenase-like lactoylglutathione lyase family enzyme